MFNTISLLGRASDRSRKKIQISQEFRGNVRGKLGQKAIGKKNGGLCGYFQIDWFCANQTSVFNVFLTEVIICSFNNNTLQKWTNGKAFNIMASSQFFAT